MNKLNTLMVLLSIILCGYSLSAQRNFVNRDWVRNFGSVGEIDRTASVVDDNQNLYVVGNTLNSDGTTDVLLTKYFKDGTLLWETTYNGQGDGDDYGVQLKLDGNSIYVAAAVQNNSNLDFGVLKFATSDGQLAWFKGWNGASDGIDIPADIDVDASGAVYVVGGSQASNLFSDYAIIKISSSGALVWDATYDHIDLHDAATKIDIQGNSISVIGASATTLTNWDYVTLKVTENNGQTQVIQRTPVSGVGLDNPLGVSSDDQNNVYVTGFSEINGNKNIQTIKLDDEFELEWVQSFDGGFEDVAKDVISDNSGNVYITGHTVKSNGSSTFVTIKYDSNGTEVWKEEYGREVQGVENRAESMTFADDGKIIVVGSTVINGNTSFTTIAYETSGKVAFIQHHGNESEYYSAEDVVVKDDEIYVTGTSIIDGVKAITTVKYSTSTRTSQTAVDANGNEYVANRLIVRFDDNAMDQSIIYNTDKRFGTLQDFVQTSVHSQMTSILGFETKNLDTYKIYSKLTPNNQISISRNGDEVPIPSFWATVSVDFPNGITPQIIAQLNSLYPVIRYAEICPVLTSFDSPDDELYGDFQESLQDSGDGGIEMETAWDYEVGNSNVKVAVFDYSIFWDHEDFINETTGESKVVAGWDYYNGVPFYESTTDEVSDHGTKCAGIIGALRNNDLGVSGIAGGDMSNGTTNTGVNLYSFGIGKNDGSGTSFEASMDAMYQAATNDEDNDFGFGIDIQNHSYGSGVFTQTQKDMVEYCWRNQSMVIAARGNANANSPLGTDNLTYPACLEDSQVINVMSSGTDGEYMYGANGGNGSVSLFGGGGDFLAPGSQETVMTTANLLADQPDYADDCNEVVGDYNCFRGTSSAAPHVAGVAALMCSRHQMINGAPTNLATEDVENILQKTATDVVGQSEDFTFNYGVGFDLRNGWGLINPTAALEAIDYPNKYIRHYSDVASGNPLHIQETINSQLTFLENSYGLAAGQYTVNRWRISWNYVEILPPNEIILDWWPLGSMSTPGMSGASPTAENTFFNINDNVIINGNVAVFNVYTFAHWVVSTSGGSSINQWIPQSPNQFKFGYSLHIENTNETSVSENYLKDAELNVYPNPTSNVLNISFNKRGSSDVTLRIHDAIGKIVVEQIMPNLTQGENKFTINMENLQKGAYVVSLSSDISVVKETFIKE
ncbi:MAG: S8 family serine peptidase [Flavobacteriales bacterium]